MLLSISDVEKMTGQYCEWVYSNVAELRAGFRRFHRGQLNALRALARNGWPNELISLSDLRWSFGTESCWLVTENRFAEISDLAIRSNHDFVSINDSFAYFYDANCHRSVIELGAKL